MERALYLWDLVEYYNNDFKEDQLSEMIFRTLKQLFMKKYCKHFTDQNVVDAQNFFKTSILGQVTMSDQTSEYGLKFEV